MIIVHNVDSTYSVDELLTTVILAPCTTLRPRTLYGVGYGFSARPLLSPMAVGQRDARLRLLAELGRVVLRDAPIIDRLLRNHHHFIRLILRN